MFIGIPHGARDGGEVLLELGGAYPGAAVSAATEKSVHRRWIKPYERAGGAKHFRSVASAVATREDEQAAEQENDGGHAVRGDVSQRPGIVAVQHVSLPQPEQLASQLALQRSPQRATVRMDCSQEVGPAEHLRSRGIEPDQTAASLAEAADWILDDAVRADWAASSSHPVPQDR